jgi:hypothetical protein
MHTLRTLAAGAVFWIFAETTIASPLELNIIPTPKIGNRSMVNPAFCGFEDDRLSMIVKEMGKDTLTQDFCSSYGKAKYSFAYGGKEKYILLESYSGRGPNATTTWLTVYRVDGALFELLNIPISWATGPASRFTYSYTSKIYNGGGIYIQLKGINIGVSECCVPSRSNEEIRLNYR